MGVANGDFLNFIVSSAFISWNPSVKKNFPYFSSLICSLIILPVFLLSYYAHGF